MRMALRRGLKRSLSLGDTALLPDHEDHPIPAPNLFEETFIKMSKLSEILECPVCYSQLSKPIGSCELGHCLCAKCYCLIKHTNNKCPVCRSTFPKRPIRNHIAEQASCLLPSRNFRQCSNALEGCKFSGTEEAISSHLPICKFVPMTCPGHLFDICNEITTPYNLEYHCALNRCCEILPIGGNVLNFMMIAACRSG